jgi:hypothetical protein
MTFILCWNNDGKSQIFLDNGHAFQLSPLTEATVNNTADLNNENQQEVAKLGTYTRADTSKL